MTKTQFGLRLRLRLIAYEADMGWFGRVHKAIEKEIARGQQRFEKLRRSGNVEALESIGDDECDQIEELLGIAFVACQAFINRVLNQVHDLNDTCLREHGKPIPLLGTRQEVLRIEGSQLVDSSITNVEAIYAVGNFWKHSEEWPVCEVAADGRRRYLWDISKMKPIQRTTAEVVSRMGTSIWIYWKSADGSDVIGRFGFR
jgi:hypothetical protein